MYCDSQGISNLRLIHQIFQEPVEMLRFPHWVSVDFLQLPIFHFSILPIYSQCDDDRVVIEDDE